MDPPVVSRMDMSRLPTPEPGRPAAEAFVKDHLSRLVAGDIVGSPRFDGGRRAALRALDAFEVKGYAARRNEVAPVHRRGASGLSPFIRHGLLTLREVWDHVDGGPSKDVAKFRDELLWQEYARHLYARVGSALGESLRYRVDGTGNPDLDRTMSCVDAVVTELEDDGWMVNQTRMWLASHWTVRLGGDWRAGEQWMFTHLLDGSRAANRLGWQWTIGAGTSKPYGFSRWQVEKRAPGLCAGCPRRHRCPIERWPDEHTPPPVDVVHPRLRADPDYERTAGPPTVQRLGSDAPDTVWLTAESLSVNDPALRAYPHLPSVFVFDEQLLKRLQLSAKRLVFLTECLGEIGVEHPGGLTIALGDPTHALAGERVATTYAPVPGWRRIARAARPVEIWPYPWLRRPGPGSAASFSAWRGSV